MYIILLLESLSRLRKENPRLLYNRHCYQLRLKYKEPIRLPTAIYTEAVAEVKKLISIRTIPGKFNYSLILAGFCL